MQLSNIAARSSGPDISRLTPEVAAHVAILADPPGSSGFDRQLDAYQAVAARWRVAGQGDRAGLASVLTDSPFGQRVHRVLDAFTRAAWPGRDAGPDAAPAQLIKAFDSLSDDDQQIVAGMHTDPSSGAPYASANDYRARLKANLEEAQAPGLERRGDVVTLSPEAQAHLAGKPTPSPASAVSAPRPEMAAAIAAYSARS